MLDSHAHYGDRQYDSDRFELLNDIFASGRLEAIIEASTSVESSRASLALADRYPGMFAVVGIHPSDAADSDTGSIESLKKLCSHEKAVGIGEIGLDYHYDFVPRSTQKKAFYAQLELAQELKLPVVVHDREAHADCLEAVLSYDITGVFHSYSGSRETAKQLLSKGWYLSFTGAVTFKNACNLREVVSYTPSDRILAETDCPYLTPVPHRGKRNSSLLLEHTLQAIAELRNISFEEAEAITAQNAKKLFGLD